jgi:hypothetical protein
MIAKLRDDDEPGLAEAKTLLRDALTWILQFVRPTVADLGTALPAPLSLRLQRAISEFGHMYRERGLGPERMLVDLKAVFGSVNGSVSIALRTQLGSEMVRWCIAAYYAEDESSTEATGEGGLAGAP